MAKILLVEDDTNLSEIYQARMEAEGYEVVSASDGESALAMAAKVKPDLIISDVMMPKISGFEMLDILRNTQGLKDTPVIMLTALGQSDDKGRADQLGADRYLVKSQVTLEDIVNAAHALLEGNSSTNPAPSASAAPATAAAATADPVAPAIDNAAATPAPTGPLSATAPAATPDTPAADSQPELSVIPVAAAPSASPDPTPAPEPAVAPAAELPTEPIAEPVTDSGAEPIAEPPQPAVEPQAEATAEPVAADTAAAAVETPPPPPDELPAQTSEPNQEDGPNFPQGGSPAAEAVAPAEPTAAPNPATAAKAVIASSARSTTQESDDLKHKIEGYERRPIPAVAVPPATPVSRTMPATPTVPPPVAVATVPPASPPAPAEPATTSLGPTPATPGQPIPPMPAAPPQPEPVAVTPAAAHAIDEKVVARAIEQLLNKSPKAAGTPKTEHGRVLPTAGTIDTSSASNIDRPQKKIISPIQHPPAPSLAELVAMEEAKEMAGTAYAGNLATQAVTPALSQPTGAEEPLPQAVLPTEPVIAAAPTPQPAPAITDAASLQAAADADPTVPNVLLPGVITPTVPAAPQPAATAKPAFDPNSIAL